MQQQVILIEQDDEKEFRLILDDNHPYSQEILSLGPLLYFKYDELDGLISIDSGPNANNGTYNNEPTFGVPSLLASESTAVQFNGINQYASYPAGIHTNPGDSFTWLLWMDPTSPNTRTLITNGYGGYLIQMESSGIITLWKSGGALIATSTSPVDTGSTWFIAIVKNGAYAKIYINAEDVTNLVTNDTIVSSNIDLTIASDGFSNFFPGVMDQVTLFGSPLSGAEIEKLYQLGNSSIQQTSYLLMESQESAIGTLRLFDTNTDIYNLSNVTGQFAAGTTVIGQSSGTSARIRYVNTAKAYANIGVKRSRLGYFLNDDVKSLSI
jgi:hypothetical protein